MPQLADMTPGLIWLLIFTACFLVFCLVAVASTTFAAFVTVTIAAVVGLAIWRRRDIANAAEYVAAAIEQSNDSRRKKFAAKAQQREEYERETHAAAMQFAKTRELRYFHTKVVGVTNDNDDGSSRQSIIKKCRGGEQLDLIHDRKNRYDKNAIVVRRLDGSQLGFLSGDLATDVVNTTKNGYFFTAYISSLTGGGLERPTRGCNMLVVQFESSIPSDVVVAYAQHVLNKDDRS
ncbi:HIRAN domain-containing protein [Pirellulales bacterium]|nr:HIRAN domain-containing protein [Pirellulales bacterium]